MNTQAIKEVLEQSVLGLDIVLQVNQISNQLTVIINRSQDSSSLDVNYAEMADTLMTVLISLNLPEIKDVKFFGRQVGMGKPEWQTLKNLNSKSSVLISSSKVLNNNLSQFQAIASKFELVKETVSVLALVGILLVLLSNAILGQKLQPVVWEYKIESINDLVFSSTMNRLGEDGWDLVFARRAKDSTIDSFSYECIFKRPRK